MRFFRLLGEALGRAMSHGAAQVGAALAYYALFSLLPLVMVAVSVAGFAYGEDAARAELLSRAMTIGGPQLAGWLDDALRDVRLSGSPSLQTAISLAALAWTAALLFRALRDALNVVWEVRSERRWVSRVLLKTLLAYGLVTLSGAALTLSMAASALISGLPRLLPGDWARRVAGLWPLELVTSFLLTLLVLMLLYKVLPETRVRWSDVRFGAPTAAALLVLVKYAIGLYLARSVLTSVFGAASSLFVVLVWVYGAALIFLFGAELCCLTARWRMPVAGS